MVEPLSLPMEGSQEPVAELFLARLFPALSSKDSVWTDAKRSHSPEKLTSGCRKPKGPHLVSVGHCLAEKHIKSLHHHCETQPRAEKCGELEVSRHGSLRPLPWQLPDLTSQKAPAPTRVRLRASRPLWPGNSPWLLFTQGRRLPSWFFRTFSPGTMKIRVYLLTVHCLITIGGT